MRTQNRGADRGGRERPSAPLRALAGPKTTLLAALLVASTSTFRPASIRRAPRRATVLRRFPEDAPEVFDFDVASTDRGRLRGGLGRPLRSLWKRRELLDDWAAAQRGTSDREQKLAGNVTALRIRSLKDRAALADDRAVARDWAELKKRCAYLKSHEALSFVHDALRVAHGAHAGQMRRSGEPFIVHPVAVASLLCGLGMDRETVAAGLLHDTVEDTAVTLEEIEATFGADVRAIVEGETKVSKLPKLAKVPDGELDSDRRRARGLRGMFGDPETAPPVSDKEREQLENLRQMFISMTDDYRIIIVKLADRLHNMRTLEHMPRHKQLRIARETLEIFAPLAHRLGLWTFKAELEDWAFRYAHPGPYAALEAALEARRSRYESALKGSRKALEARLAADPKLRGVKVSVSGRTKELYSLWLKMERAVEERRAMLTAEVFAPSGGAAPVAAVAPAGGLWGAGREGGHGPAFGSFELEDAADAPYVLDDQDLDGVPDVVALRVVLEVPRDGAAEPLEAWRERSTWLCYHVLGLVQQLKGCEAVPRVKDYISFPKPNGYQSLHASLRREAEDQVVEVQIRTAWMHEVAEHGMAAHWLYKDGLFSVEDLDDGEPGDGRRGVAKPYAVSWLNSVKDWQHEIHSSREFVETIRKEVLGKRVFVFLRDGQILDLSRGATVLDAAFHIHTEIGLKVATAYVNGQEVQLSYELKNGDVVSVSTSEDARPQLDWLRMAQRRSTRAKLRAYFREEQRLYEVARQKTIDSAM